MRQLLAATITVSMLCWTEAQAAPFPSANVPPSASNPLEDTYQESDTANCSFGTCALVFPATIYAKVLVSHVSCFFEVPTGATVLSAVLESKSGSQKNYLSVEQYGSNGTYTSYVSNEPTYLFYTKGEQPTIQVVNTGSLVLNLICTISGNRN